MLTEIKITQQDLRKRLAALETKSAPPSEITETILDKGPIDTLDLFKEFDRTLVDNKFKMLVS